MKNKQGEVILLYGRSSVCKEKEETQSCVLPNSHRMGRADLIVISLLFLWLEKSSRDLSTLKLEGESTLLPYVWFVRLVINKKDSVVKNIKGFIVRKVIREEKFKTSRVRKYYCPQPLPDLGRTD